MQHKSLNALVDEHLALASAASSGRSSLSLYGGTGHQLRQTLVVLVAGQRLHEHENPGEATLQVLRGTARLTAAEEEWTGNAGDHVVIPDGRHALEAVTDCAVILTVAIAA